MCYLELKKKEVDSEKFSIALSMELSLLFSLAWETFCNCSKCVKNMVSQSCFPRAFTLAYRPGGAGCVGRRALGPQGGRVPAGLFSTALF